MEEFDSKEFSIRAHAVKYILDIYGRDKHIIQRDNKKRSGYLICFQCENLNCSFNITCGKSRKKDSDELFKYEQENSFLEHGRRDSNDNIISFCTNAGKMTTVRDILLLLSIQLITITIIIYRNK